MDLKLHLVNDRDLHLVNDFYLFSKFLFDLVIIINLYYFR